MGWSAGFGHQKQEFGASAHQGQREWLRLGEDLVELLAGVVDDGQPSLDLLGSSYRRDLLQRLEQLGERFSHFAIAASASSGELPGLSLIHI